jgi:hypothetical protein
VKRQECLSISGTAEAIMLGEILLFYMLPDSQGGKKNGSCLCKWRFLYSWVLVKFGNAIQLMPLGSPPSRAPMHMGTYPTTKMGQLGLTLDKLDFGILSHKWNKRI